MIKAFAIFSILLLLFVATSNGQSRRSLVLISPVSDTKGTPWEGIPIDSAEWLVRTTYEIDPLSKNNKVFRNTSLVSLMCESVIAGRIMAFGSESDSFTSRLTLAQALAAEKTITNGSKSTRIRIVEDIVGMKNSSKQYHCLIGIAPEVQDSTGRYNSIFWLYFNHLKPLLAKTVVSDIVADNWLTIFDRRGYAPRLISSADTLRYPNIVYYPLSHSKR